MTWRPSLVVNKPNLNTLEISITLLSKLKDGAWMEWDLVMRKFYFSDSSESVKFSEHCLNFLKMLSKKFVEGWVRVWQYMPGATFSRGHMI